MKLKEGKKAPDFKLSDKDGEIHSLKSLKADNVVLYFYPKDDTPGCTVEAIAFEKDLPKFKKLKTEVIGISGGTDKTKEKFCKKHGLESLLLLTDREFETAKAYDSFGEKTFMGRKYEGIFRNTFVLDKDRKISKIFEKADPKTHTAEVLDYLKSL